MELVTSKFKKYKNKELEYWSKISKLDKTEIKTIETKIEYISEIKKVEEDEIVNEFYNYLLNNLRNET